MQSYAGAARIVGRVSCWVALALAARPAHASTVTFDNLIPGTTYGPPGQSAGDLVFTEDGIGVSIEEFVFSSGTPVFLGSAKAYQVGVPVPGFPAPPGFGSGNIMGVSNVSLEFDFSALGFAVDHVTLDFASGGGNENISINGQPVWHDLIVNAPINIAPDVTLSAIFDSQQLVGGLELTGPISTLRIGGQEFALDNVVATPEPGTVALLACGGLALLRRR